MSTKPYGLTVKAVVIDEQGRCLLIRRSSANTSFVGCWEWPGGKVDPGEDFAAAVVRETKEEAGLDVDITGLGGATSFEMPKVNVVVLCMEARVLAGDLRLSNEHDAFDWVRLDELATSNLPSVVADFMVAYAARKAEGST
jgi:8-oxo-dGTP diphosphatase